MEKHKQLLDKEYEQLLTQFSKELEKLQLNRPKATISISSYKHSKGDEVVINLLAQEDKSICPVHKTRKYLSMRGRKSGAIFINGSKPFTKYKFNQMLKKCCQAAGLPSYSSHCFRIGGANLAAELGRSDAEIRMLGRWKSNAINLYLRQPKPILINDFSNTSRSANGGDTSSGRRPRRQR